MREKMPGNQIIVDKVRSAYGNWDKKSNKEDSQREIIILITKEEDIKADRHAPKQHMQQYPITAPQRGPCFHFIDV